MKEIFVSESYIIRPNQDHLRKIQLQGLRLGIAFSGTGPGYVLGCEVLTLEKFP